MKIEFLNPFILAAAEVLKREAQTSVERGKIALKKGLYMSDDVTALVSLVGRVEGPVLYSMSYEMAKELVSRMMGGQPFDQFDELAQSGIAELANVITGLSSTKLAQAGYSSVISVPMLIIGKGARISTLKTDRLKVPLETQCGTFNLELALSENLDASSEFDNYAPEVATITLG